MNASATRGETDARPPPAPLDGPDDVGPDPLPERRISDVETIKALSDPLRLRILEVMTAGHDETFTVKRLATSLGVSQTKLYHHVNLLVERELIRPGRPARRLGDHRDELPDRAAPDQPRSDRSWRATSPGCTTS